MKIKPSANQKEIIKFAKKGRGHGAIDSVAGSGKTTTLMLLLQELTGDTCFLSFSAAIKAEISERIKLWGFKASVSTINGLGFGAVMREYKSTKLNDSKYFFLAQDVIKDSMKQNKLHADLFKYQEKRVASTMRDLARKMRVDLKHDEEGARATVYHHGIEFDSLLLENAVIELMPKLLERGRQQARYIVDFTDQIWLPVVEGLTPTKRYDYLLVDECQDLSKAQLALVKMALKEGGRVIFVGDPRQAIFGFAGADANSFQRIVEDMNCTVLPLDVCYRCPKSVIRLAQEIVPNIKWAEDAIEGVIDTMPQERLALSVQDGDLILCRTVAPLVELCFSLIKDGVPAQIKGRDIGKSLTALVAKIYKEESPSFLDDLNAYAYQERTKILEANGGDEEDTALQAIQDKTDVIRILWIEKQCQNVEDFDAAISALFSDGRAAITLSSVHRAKGLEAERVFILRRDLLPLPNVRQGTWQYEQEKNLCYVAWTRTRNALFFVA